MRILIFSQYFWPESFIINDLAMTLKRQGHNIVVATGKPNYPDGKIFDGYQAGGIQRETFDSSIDVLRVPLFPRGKGGAFNLCLNYLSFICSGLKYFPGLLKAYSFDVILVFAGSPNVALPALPLRWLKRAHLAIWVQDLWPESVSATGFISNKFLLRMIGRVVRLTYHCADTVLVQSHAFIDPVARYAGRDKVVYYPNSMIESPGPNAPMVSQGLPEGLIEILQTHFCVIFAGNIGTAQAIETLVKAAQLLKDTPKVRLVMIGSGSMFDWVKSQKEKMGLDQLVLPGRFPSTLMPSIFEYAGGLLVSLKDEEIFSYTIPSKVQAYLAAGKPIIASLNGEGARVIQEAGAGFTCPAEDPVELARCIRSLYGLSESQRKRFGEAGKKYFLKHYEMGGQARRLVEILQARMA